MGDNRLEEKREHWRNLCQMAQRGDDTEKGCPKRSVGAEGRITQECCCVAVFAL